MLCYIILVYQYSRLEGGLAMVFRANSMTFRIHPDKWDRMANYRLKDELEEFLRWFGFNVGSMSENDAAAGWQIARDLITVMEGRGMDIAPYMHEEADAARMAKGSASIH